MLRLKTQLREKEGASLPTPASGYPSGYPSSGAPALSFDAVPFPPVDGGADGGGEGAAGGGTAERPTGDVLLHSARMQAHRDAQVYGLQQQIATLTAELSQARDSATEHKERHDELIRQVPHRTSLHTNS